MKNKLKAKQKKFQKNKKAFLLMTVLCMGIGFAFLSSNLTITGNTSVSGNKWNVYFTNVQVNEASVEASVVPTTSGTNTTSLDYTVTLDKPGDFYEFTVDAVNNGTIDAMIQNVNMTSLDTDVAKYLSYTATYEDGTSLVQNDILAKDSTTKYKVRVEFQKNIEPADLDENEVNLNLAFEVNYTQYRAVPSNFVKLIKNSALSDTNLDFTQISSPTNGRGIYIMESTKRDTYPIYYYRGAVTNNNAKFAGFCWKIVRTTETGGTKLIYNGLPELAYDEYNRLNRNSYINMENDDEYPFSFDEENKEWINSNETNGKEVVTTFTVNQAGNYYLNYKALPEENDYFDGLEVHMYKDGVEIGTIDELSDSTGHIYLENLLPSNIITVKYSNYNFECHDDCEWQCEDDCASECESSCGSQCENSCASQCESDCGNQCHNQCESECTCECDDEECDENCQSDCEKWCNEDCNIGCNDECNEECNNQCNGECNSQCNTQCNAECNSNCTSEYTFTFSLDMAKGQSSMQCLNTKGSKTQLNFSKFNTNVFFSNSGYMFGTKYTSKQTMATDTYVYGNTFTYENGVYTLRDTQNNADENHHYTCLSSDTTCSSVSYIFHQGGIPYFEYIVLSDGKSIEDALSDMNLNINSSSVKTFLDNWFNNTFKENFTKNNKDYNDYLEDAIWCNDRSINTLEVKLANIYQNSTVNNGWKPNGGYLDSFLRYSPVGRYVTGTPSLACQNKNDSFTVEDSTTGNGALTYPIGLLTLDEVMLAGGKSQKNLDYYLYSNKDWWTMSPHSFGLSGSSVFYVNYEGNIHNASTDYGYIGVRPSISIKPTVKIASGGDGTAQKPYEFVVE